MGNREHGKEVFDKNCRWNKTFGEGQYPKAVEELIQEVQLKWLGLIYWMRRMHGMGEEKAVGRVEENQGRNSSKR